MKKKVLVALLAGCMVMSLAACGGGSDDTASDSSAETTDDASADDAGDAAAIETVAEGKLTVATSPDYAPYEFYAIDEEGNPTLAGFDLALAQYIADYMGLGGSNDDEKVSLLIKYLRGMCDDLKIPHCIKNYGADSYPCEQGFVPEDVFLNRLHDIAVNAIGDACTGSNPRQPSVEEMEKLLKCCYYDTEVDF